MRVIAYLEILKDIATQTEVTGQIMRVHVVRHQL